MGDVVLFNGITKLDLPADQVLDNTPRDLELVVILGWDADGELYFASSGADGGDVLWLMEKVKKALLSVDDEE